MPTLQIPPRFNRGAHRDPAATEESALYLIRHMCDKLGLPDLSQQDVLDVGCGTKFTQALLKHALPIKSYVGVDVYHEMIVFLRKSVSDPRFEYHHIDVHNDLYNPDGAPMTADTDLGVGDRTFDIICLFSVFTHLAPHDYGTMLRLLRRYVRPNGRLIYTLFIDELTEDGYGFIDKVERGLRAREGQDGETTPPTPTKREVEPFVDVNPDKPLLCAMYSREYAHELIEGTGWRPLELLPPNRFAQHHFICVPA
jgi:SAM-dependent methyltransferase